MKIQNRRMAVLLVGAMSAALLTGCGQNEAEAVLEEYPSQEQSVEKTEQSTLPSETENSLSDIVVGVEGWSAFDENVTIKIPVYDRHIKDAPNVTNNYWTDWIQENFGDKYNITVEYVAINRTEVLSDYALLAEKDELPTIFMEYDFHKLAQWAAQGYLT